MTFIHAGMNGITNPVDLLLAANKT